MGVRQLAQACMHQACNETQQMPFITAGTFLGKACALEATCTARPASHTTPQTVAAVRSPPYLARRVACSSCSLAASREVSRRSVRPSTPSACSLLSSKGADCRAADAAAASGAERMVWREGGEGRGA